MPWPLSVLLYSLLFTCRSCLILLHHGLSTFATVCGMIWLISVVANNKYIFYPISKVFSYSTLYYIGCYYFVTVTNCLKFLLFVEIRSWRWNENLRACLATLIWWRAVIKTNKQTPWPLVRERTIPTDWPPLVDEIYCQLLWIERCRVVSAADPLRSLIWDF
jgi:hypothetical protein